MEREDNTEPAASSGDEFRPADSAMADARFPNTRWSVVLAIQEHDDTSAEKALAELCRLYWYPLYAYVRRRGHSPPQAEDLTQEFFTKLLAKDFLATVRQEKGKLRSFLLTILKRFLANEWERASAQKRGGGLRHVPIDQDWAEDQFHHEPADTTTPEDYFERQWARTLFESVLQLLREDFASRDKLDHFDALKEALAWNNSDLPYAEIGERLEITEGAVKVAVFRMRKRYREILEQEIERTVGSAEEIDDEIRYLFEVFER